MHGARKRTQITDRRERRRDRREDHTALIAAAVAEREARDQVIKPKKAVKPFLPKTERQAEYADAIDDSTYTFAIGPAGTGKTYVAARKAADHLKAHTSHIVILTRPAVEAAGEKLGFLPGELDEKFGPYTKPFMRVLIDALGQGYVDCAVKNDRLQVAPMAFMRGESYENALIIGDEMQNATRAQFKMLLTRLGEGSRMVIDGDPTQSDIGSDSGLMDAVRRLGRLDGVSVIRFGKADIVRHSMTQHIIEAYEDRDAGGHEGGHMHDQEVDLANVSFLHLRGLGVAPLDVA